MYRSDSDPSSVPGRALSDDQWLVEVARCEAARGTLIGKYRVLEEVARGGQGVVMRAIDTQSRQQVALKRLICGAFSAERDLERFRRELAILERLEHPGIVRLIELIEHEGLPVLVFEWVDGLPADKWAEQLPAAGRVEAILRAFMTTCEAVQHAHERGVVHRDLKPSNILVEAPGQPHVLDFGIARLTDDQDTQLTQTGEFLGSPPFSSPEQLTGGTRVLDARTDVYSLGSILFLQLTHRLPIDTMNDPVGPAHAVLTRTPARPSTLVPELPKGVDDILLEALCKEPEWRYASAQELRDDVGRLLSGQRVRANPRSLRRAVLRLIRRQRAVIALSVALAFVAVTLGYQAYSKGLAARIARASDRSSTETLDDIFRIATTGTGRTLSTPESGDRLIDERERRGGATAPSQAHLCLRVAEGYLADGEAARALARLDAGLAYLAQDSAPNPELELPLLVSRVSALTRLCEYPLAHEALERVLLRESEFAHLRSSWDRALSAGIKLCLACARPEQAAGLRVLQVEGRDTLEERDDGLTDLMILVGLGRFEEARESTRSAAEAAASELGDDAPRTLTARRLHGLALMESGHYGAAIDVLSAVLESRGLRDDEPAALAEALIDLGQLERIMGLNEEAEQHFTRAITLSESVTGRQPTTSLAFCYRGQVHKQRGNIEAALADMQRAYELQCDHLGERHPDTGVTLSSMAMLMAMSGRFEEARQQAREALTIRSNALGPDHLQLGDMLNNLALIETRAGDHEAALEHYRAMRRHLERASPEPVPFLVFAERQVGNALLALGRADEAQAAFEAGVLLAQELGLSASNPWSRSCGQQLQRAVVMQLFEARNDELPADWRERAAEALLQFECLGGSPVELEVMSREVGLIEAAAREH